MSATKPLLVIVTGCPGTGKTTLATHLADVFRIPLICKDDIKEAMADCMSVENREESRKLGRASYAVMDALVSRLCQSGKPFIMESNFPAEFYTPKVAGWQSAYGYQVFQILCTADPDILMERITERIVSGKRHPVHKEQGDIESGAYRQGLGDGRLAPLEVEGEFMEVDTTDISTLDTTRIEEKLRLLLSLQS